MDLVVAPSGLGDVVLNVGVDFGGDKGGIVCVVVCDVAIRLYGCECIYASIRYTNGVDRDDSTRKCSILDKGILSKNMRSESGDPETTILKRKPSAKIILKTRRNSTYRVAPKIDTTVTRTILWKARHIVSANHINQQTVNSLLEPALQEMPDRSCSIHRRTSRMTRTLIRPNAILESRILRRDIAIVSIHRRNRRN